MKSNPHFLMSFSLVYWYVSLFVPSLVVVNVPLASPYAQPTSPVGIERKSYLWNPREISAIDPCVYIETRWSAFWQEYFFKGWGFLGGLVFWPLVYGGIPYLQKHPVPILNFFLGVVTLAFVPIFILFSTAEPTSSVFCNPPPPILIKQIYPFWPWLLLWGTSTALSVRVGWLLAEPKPPVS